MKLVKTLRRWWEKVPRAYRIAGIVALGFIWLLVVYLLPRTLSNVVAAIGLGIGAWVYSEWAHDPDSPYGGGLALGHRRRSKEEFQRFIDELLAREEELAARWERATLLRATEAEDEAGKELLRPATEGTPEPPEHLLRSSDQPNHKETP